MSVKETRNVAMTALSEQRGDTFAEWKEKWKKECISGDKKLDAFFLLFVKVYQYVESSKDYNKYLNSVWKRRFLKLLCIGFIVYVGFGGYNLYKGAEKMSVLIENGLLIIMLSFLCGIMSKWLDIKKYQETWVRHSWHLHMMEMEMLRYISEIEPYKGVDKKKEFVRRILKIWDKNEEKFVHNMEEREAGLMDFFSNLKI